MKPRVKINLDNMKYVDTELLKAEIKGKIAEIEKDPAPVDRETILLQMCKINAFREVLSVINRLKKDSLQQEQTDMGEVSDGYHTFNELYYYRMLYNAAFFNLLPKAWVHKSKRHHTGEECFGGGWFIVMANLPTGQISNHYELKDWDLFKIPEKEFADEWDGHTPQEAAERLHKYLQQKQPESTKGKFVFPNFLYARTVDNKTIDVSYAPQSMDAVEYIKNDPTEQPEVDLEEFTQKMNDWKARYNYPDNIPVKAAIAFTMRMCIMYPEFAKNYYDSLPKTTLD